MNEWLKKSILLSSTGPYYDLLIDIYPKKENENEFIDQELWKEIQNSITKKDNDKLFPLLVRCIKSGLKFPFEDHRVGFFEKNNSNLSIKNNPKVINEICQQIYTMDLDDIYNGITAPKKSSRQIGPFFKNWIKRGSLGYKPIRMSDFKKDQSDAILDAGDTEMVNFAKKLGFNRTDNEKGLDFIARINKKYIIGEAKYLSTYGGAQSKNIKEAISIFEDPNEDIIKIAILDGVCFIPSNETQYKTILNYKNNNIMSALLLKEFLHSL